MVVLKLNIVHSTVMGKVHRGLVRQGPAGLGETALVQGSETELCQSF